MTVCQTRSISDGSVGGRRRQVEAEDLAARIEVARVDDQRAVAIVDARPGPGRRDQPPQDRRDALGIDRELEAVEHLLVGGGALAGLKVEELVGIDG